MGIVSEASFKEGSFSTRGMTSTALSMVMECLAFHNFCEQSLHLNSMWMEETAGLKRELHPKQKHKLKFTVLAKNSSRRPDVMPLTDSLRAGFIPAQLSCSLSVTYTFLLNIIQHEIA